MGTKGRRDFAELVREHRQNENMSQTLLAYRANELLPRERWIFQDSISRIESCKKELTWELVVALATVLGIDPRTAAIKARVLPHTVEELDARSFAQTLDIVERTNDEADVSHA